MKWKLPNLNDRAKIDQGKKADRSSGTYGTTCEFTIIGPLPQTLKEGSPLDQAGSYKGPQ